MIDDIEGVGSESFSVPEEQETLEVATDELEVGENGTDEEAETEGEPQAEAKPKGKSVQERIDEITADKYAERRRAEAAEARLAALEAAAKPEAAHPESNGRPDPSDYEFGSSDELYTEALSAWKADQIVTARLAEHAQKQQVESAVQQLETKYSQRVAEVRAEIPDYDEVVTQTAARGEWPCPAIVALAAKESEVGPKVLHHLATNKAEAIALAGMSPIEQAIAFGRLEAKYLNQPAPQPNIATNAPEPAPARTKGGQFASPSGLDDRLSPDEWLRRRNAQIRA